MNLNRTSWLAVLCTLGIFAACQSAQTQSSKTDLSAKAFQQKMESTPNEIILDVRTPEEFADGHIAGALNLDWDGKDFETATESLDKNVPVMVYCAGGGRSSAAAKALKSKGFKEIYNLEDGISDWEDKGFPVTKK